MPGECTVHRVAVMLIHTAPCDHRDQAAAANNTNLYGHWPFLMQVHADGTADAVFLHNSNGMDIFIRGDIMTYK